MLRPRLLGGALLDDRLRLRLHSDVDRVARVGVERGHHAHPERVLAGAIDVERRLRSAGRQVRQRPVVGVPDQPLVGDRPRAVVAADGELEVLPRGDLRPRGGEMELVVRPRARRDRVAQRLHHCLG